MASLSNIQGIVVNDPTKVIHGPSNNTIQTGQGLWSQIQHSGGNPYVNSIDPYEGSFIKLEKKMQALELQHTLLKLKVLGMEGKFTQEEVTNIRKMIMSEDEASRTLANTIIENA